VIRAEPPWIRRLRGGAGRPAGLVLLALLVAALVTPGVPLVPSVRLVNFDAYQILAPREPASAPAVVVAIDDASIARHGQWPWPRTLLARLVSRVADAAPAVVGIDIIMPEPDRLSAPRLPQLLPELGADVAERLAGMPSNEVALATALGRVKAILGAAGLEGPEAGAAGAGGGWVPLLLRGGDPGRFVRRFTGALRSVPEIDRVAVGRGLLNADVERGVVRRVPLIARIDDTLVPGFALELLRVAAGEPAMTVETGRDGVHAITLGDVRVPTERDGSLRVHYSLHDPRRFVSAAAVLAGEVPAERITRRAVLVAVTAIGLSDFQATPVIDRMSGAEIHAQALENIFDGLLLSRPPRMLWVEAASLGLVGTLLVLAVPALPRRYSSLLFLGAVVMAGIMGFVVYRHALVLVDFASPSIALAVLFGFMVTLTLVEVDRHQRALREALQHEREAAARLAGELEAARRIQMGILPRPADLAGNGGRYTLHAVLEPARAVGGDLYDFFEPTPDRLFILLGDVAGKGLPGCLFMAVSKSLCRTTALRLLPDTATMMSEANREITRDNRESLFVTVFAGVLDVATGVLEYSNAGHDDPYLVRADGSLARLSQAGGPPLCVIDDFPYAAERHRLAPGDLLCLLTDGVVEAMNRAGEFYGRARLEAVLRAAGKEATAEGVCEAIRADVARFTEGAEPADDLAILTVRWNGSEAAAT
jgi:serine phosphatase RsbU (regulator of sigma subunit)/CHASE2 domain-containing sensor protein